MPFQFILPTTSSFSFSSSFTCESHPSLTLNASTHRGVVKSLLKKHKRLPAASQGPNLPLILSDLNGYLPYLLAIDAGLGNKLVSGEEVSVVLTSTPAIEWRPTLSDHAVPGKQISRVKIQSLEYELFFVLSTVGYTHTLLARSSLHPLYVTSGAPLSTQARTTAITNATKHLLDAASVHDYLARRAEGLTTQTPCSDIAQSTARAMSLLALAEATLLAVLKDDPYPAVVAQDRNENDREWMYKAPEIPKVRAHLFARLCLAAADHAAQASSLCQAQGRGVSRLNEGLLRYLEDFRKTSRAKACRFFGIDAELSGQTGNAIGWLRCGLQELGVESKEAKKGLSLSRMKKDWTERREDKKIERGTNWGADAGKLEETRVIEMLEAKWMKINDTMLTQPIPSPGTLIAGLPSGRDMHTIKPYQVPELGREALEAMRAPPDRLDDFGDEQLSSDDDERTAVATPVGAFPGTQDQYGRSASAQYHDRSSSAPYDRSSGARSYY
ncbi:DNA-directed RNA polymerase core subunit rpc40 [Hypoxylon texense]